jgi:hypothetical protein
MDQTATLNSPRQAPQPYPRTILTVRQLIARHPAFTESAIRCFIHKAKKDTPGIPCADAFKASMRRIGRRVLFDEGRFLEWVDVCSEGAAAHGLLKGFRRGGHDELELPL